MSQTDRDETTCSRLAGNDPSLSHLRLSEPRDIHCSPNFEVFVESLRGNTSVKSVFLAELVVQTIEEEQLSRLLEGMSELRSLEAFEISIAQINHPSRIHGSSFAKFISRARKLKTCVIWPFVFLSNDEDVQLVADALFEHPSLEQLALMNLLSSDDENDVVIDPILASLTTCPQLNVLQLSAGFRVRGEKKPIRDTEILCKLLHPSSGKLNVLALRNFGLTEEQGIQMAKTLTEADCQIQTLDIRFNAFRWDAFRAFYEMLKTNSIICYIESGQVLGDREEYYLGLNRAGRHKWLYDISATRDQLIDILINSRDDLDKLYYFISSKPVICRRGVVAKFEADPYFNS